MEKKAYNNEIYQYAEKKSNRFNMICLVVMCALALLAIVFNEFGLFTQSKELMRYSMLELIFFDIIPFVIYIINDKIIKNKKSALGHRSFKVLILALAFQSVIDLSIVLSWQATLLLVLPLLFAAQYKNKRNVFIIVLVVTLLMVPVITYASFFLGIYDANMLKPLTAEQAEDIKNRLDIATPKRMFELFFHYAVPKMLCLGAIEFCAVAITTRTADMLNYHVELTDKINEEIQKKSEMQKSVIEDLADIIESRDIETGEHIKRTKRYVTVLVNTMKKDDKYKDILTDKFCDNIINSAPLHDIGKIVVSDTILCKPGKLTPEEFDKMKIHTTKGGDIIRNILSDLGDQDFLNVAYDIATFHHEKWNGTGYPQNLAGEDIPLPARIMAIADVFDALVAERVYKPAMPVEKAINIIIGDAGTHFDPNIVEIFKTVTAEFEAIAKAKM